MPPERPSHTAKSLWDFRRKDRGPTLYRVISDRFDHGAADESVPVYAAAGYYYPGKDLDALPAELLGYVELGHTLVKIKIGGASLDEARAGSRRRLRS